MLDRSEWHRLLLFLGLTALTAHSTAAGENWPDFRGPTMDGRSDATQAPLSWSETENVRWKTAVPGVGHSTPVIWGRQIWLTTATRDGKTMSALCIDPETGEVTAQIKVLDVAEPQPINASNSYASPSPVIEGRRVYVHFGTYGTAAIDTQSSGIVWKRTDLNLDHKEGPGSSPVLWNDLVIVTCDGTDVQYVIALDKQTGTTRWKTKRSADLADIIPDFRKAYSTPLVVDIAGRPVLISTGAHSAYGYDPATGHELWRLPYSGFSNVSRPVVGQGLIFLNTGYMKPQLLAVKLGISRLVDDSQIVWRHSMAIPNKPSVVLVGDLVFMVSDNGVATCLEAGSGKPIWSKRLGGNFSASPIAAAGRIYFCDQDGMTTVVAPSREYKELAVNQLDGGCMASPAVAGKALFLRTKACLYRLEE
jgi:outer membrane protein assembly factor BamB